MAGNLSVEKGICVFMLFITGLDNAITWPISCFIVTQSFKIDLRLVGILSGLFVLFHGLGKGLSYRLTEDLSRKLSTRSMLFLGFLGLAVSKLLFLLSNSFLLLVFSRFLCGVFSNTQGCIRKVLKALLVKEGSSDLKVLYKALIGQRVGFLAGVLISAFFFNLEIAGLKEILDSRLVLIGFFVMLLELAALAFVFLIDSSIQITAGINRYAELPEIKSIHDNIDSERQTKEHPDSGNIFNPAILAQENVPSEENVGPEDIKFYSPRVVNQPKSFKKIQSARPQLGTSFDFPEGSGILSDLPSEEDKKVHISFIDEEFENEENEEKKESQGNKTQILNPPVENFAKNKAARFWVVFSISVGILLETVPVSIFLCLVKRNSLFVSSTAAVCLVVALGMSQIVIPKLMQHVSVYTQIVTFSATSSLIFLSFPILTAFTKDSIIFIPLWIFLILSAECLAPAGLILITDSVSLAEREKEVFLNGRTCILLKAAFAYIAGIILTSLSYCNFGMALLSVPYLVVIYYRKHLESFHYIFELPYKT